MGFVDPCLANLGGQGMTARDYLWLAVLGALARRPMCTADLERAVAALTSSAWQPGSSMIDDAVSELAASGMLASTPEDQRLSLTDGGSRMLARLLAQPLPKPLSAHGRAGIGLKLTFLDLAPLAVRRHQISAMLTACQCHLAAQAQTPPAWQLAGPFGRAWLDLRHDQLEDLAAFLRHQLAILRHGGDGEA